MSDKVPPIPPSSEGSKAEMVDSADAEEAEKFFDPVTGEQISKNAFKKLSKAPKKEKKEKVVPVAKSAADKKEKKVKEPEEVWTDSTPFGKKKNIEGVFPTTYQPKYVEAAWQAWWEKEGYYTPDLQKALKSNQEDKFVMVIPPPNVTGSLHLGHALTTAVEDTLTRWHRMKGKVVLWVPGTDHAGIATQSVVEKRLKKDEGITRHDLGREEFMKRVWQWKEMYGNKITNQIRCLGASVDWSRESFTMDANLSRAVTEAFCRFHEKGLLYRDTRLINWSCALQSAISEIEVDYIDLEGRTFLPVPNHKEKATYEFGMITSFAYKVYNENSEVNEEIVVATTRLETMLGDTAVAVHPDDPRYTHLHGKFLVHPFTDRKIPIITDSVLVDMSFGTGAVKVTPAHDPNDYLCGKRNNLEFIIMLSEDGKINNNGGKFAGMMRYDARIEMEKQLEQLGFLRGKEVNKMRLGLCSRSGDIIEPMLTPQWYVNCNNMAKRATDAVKNGDLKIFPEFHEATWFRWLENIRDWCVSRQLWWGHRIPAYFVKFSKSEVIDKNDPVNNDRWFVARSEAEARKAAGIRFNMSGMSGIIDPNSKNSGADISTLVLEQDEDVLDTWFSSGLFPFSVFGWPEETEDFKAFYPTSLLETGADILFFWVARMVMMGLELTDTLPFTTVYLHAMVRDKYGRKMSKSLGNVIDPLEVINGCTLNDLLAKIDEGNLPAKEIVKAKEGQVVDFPEGIPECGADALRFGLLAYTVQGRDVNLDIKRVVGYRQFCNKLWNAVKFGLTYLTDFEPTPTMHATVTAHPCVSGRDLCILSKLNNVIVEVNKYIEDYTFGLATNAIHSFFIYDVCDTYLELMKPVFYDLSEENKETMYCAKMTLYTVLEQFLRLIHPFMPFVSEELWQRLPFLSKMTEVQSIMIAPYPTEMPSWANEEAEKQMELIKELIHGGRSLRSDYKLANHIKADFYYSCTSPDMAKVITLWGQDFCTLARANQLVLLEAGSSGKKGFCVKVISDQISLFIDLTEIIDVSSEISRLTKERERLELSIDTYAKKINVANYETKVPESIRLVNSEKISSFELELEATIRAISSFELMRA